MDRSSRRGTIAAVLLAAFCLIAGLAGCGRGESEHYTAAHELERKLLMKGGDITYADPGYLNVARELEQVSPLSTDYSRAQAELKKIKEARRIKASEVYSLDYLPKDLEGVSLTSLAPAMPDRPEVYQRIHTISSPPPQPAGEGASAQEMPASTEPAAAQAGQVAKADSSNHYPPVILYGTSWCGYCARARAYFNHRHVPFVDKDVEADPAAAQELLAKVGSYGGVPVIDVGGTIIRGFDVRGIDAALARGSR